MRSTSAALARVNVNLPTDARDKLRDLAKAAGRPDAVYARDLLLDALERAVSAELRRRLAASRTPERRERDLEIVATLERLRGSTCSWRCRSTASSRATPGGSRRRR